MITTDKLKSELLESRLVIEQAEVILSTLLRLNNPDGETFLIPHEDVIVLLNTSLGLLKS